MDKMPNAEWSVLQYPSHTVRREIRAWLKSTQRLYCRITDSYPTPLRVQQTVMQCIFTNFVEPCFSATNRSWVNCTATHRAWPDTLHLGAIQQASFAALASFLHAHVKAVNLKEMDEIRTLAFKRRLGGGKKITWRGKIQHPRGVI